MRYLHLFLKFALFYGLTFLVFVALDVLFGDEISWIRDLVRPLVLFVCLALLKGLEIMHTRLNR